MVSEIYCSCVEKSSPRLEIMKMPQKTKCWFFDTILLFWRIVSRIVSCRIQAAKLSPAISTRGSGLDIVVSNEALTFLYRTMWHAGRWGVRLCGLQDTKESDYVVHRTLRSWTMWHAGHWVVRLCGMCATEKSDNVAWGTLWSRTMWHVWHWEVGLCGMWDIVKSDYVACGTLKSRTMWHEGHW